MFLAGKVGYPKTLANQDRKPLLDLIHPRAVDRRMHQRKTGMYLQPGEYLLSCVHPHIIHNEIDARDAWGQVRFYLFQECQELDLAFARCNLSPDLARAGVECG